MAKTPVAGGYYPPVGFHFKVEFPGIGNDNDCRFQSVSGLTVEYDTESFKEGVKIGLNINFPCGLNIPTSR